MEENRSYSLGLYEKAIPVGMTFPQMFAIAKQCGFDRLEISVDETDWRQERLEWDSSRQRELGALSRAMGCSAADNVPFRAQKISLWLP